MVTGGGKSAIFSVPILILREMARNPRLYPDLPTRALPQGIVVMPTKGLAANIVLESNKFDIPAFAYCHESITEARKTRRNLVNEIRERKTWNVVCVDPEHLRDKAWREIAAYELYRANILYGCVDEVRLINQWGANFRPLFRYVGPFFRGRLPSSTSIFALSATLQPGSATKSVCRSLGLFGNDFFLFRSSSQRHNTQFIMEPLQNGVGGRIFPQLFDYLNSRRKAVIHCRTIDDVLRGPHRLRHLKMYHSLRSSADKEILRLVDEDPECQKQLAASSNPDSAPRKRSETVKPLEHAKTLVLTEKVCYNAVINGIYENPPLDTSTLDCIAAGRRLPCSLCATRNNTSLVFSAPAFSPGVELPLFVHPPAADPIATLDKALRLKKEREHAESAERVRENGPPGRT
ncbi:p-loop containing nucleoside triphosphate hydrolase protein [Mycena venus]|uniref:DNA 3'-5' helicase n=1 Tax=Mycena venus TaxID=2733690 RepID=A0A8H7D1P9_9AGAR|nr:p-loop containing nucleoside triphosphate hydrolase protein [Mycena venus]KAF7372099.1 p-loop containing nucleoside triphosphate hydrolase protein [Mycena venus]